MDKLFPESCSELLTLHNQLVSKGFKNKTLAKSIGVYPSAYSVLMNSVVIPVVELHQKKLASKDKIEDIFNNTVNVSEYKTRQRIKGYTSVFRELISETEESLEKKFESNMVSDFLSKTPTESLKLIEGLYNCYYLSTSGYKFKKEPFMIYFDKKNRYYKVKKGNDNGAAKYNGFAYVSNGELLTIHLKEQGTFTQDHFIAHLHIPLTYTYSINLLQGVAISLANNKMPIARKLILERFDTKPDRQKFQQMETKYFDKNTEENSEIVEYLKSSNCVIDYMNIPFPSYNTSDLIVEREVRKLAKI